MNWASLPAELLDVHRPLEVRAGDAAGVGEDVGDDGDAPVVEDCVAAGRDRVVGALEDDAGTDLAGVVVGDDLAECGRGRGRRTPASAARRWRSVRRSPASTTEPPSAMAATSASTSRPSPSNTPPSTSDAAITLAPPIDRGSGRPRSRRCRSPGRRAGARRSTGRCACTRRRARR